MYKDKRGAVCMFSHNNHRTPFAGVQGSIEVIHRDRLFFIFHSPAPRQIRLSFFPFSISKHYSPPPPTDVPGKSVGEVDILAIRFCSFTIGSVKNYKNKEIISWHRINTAPIIQPNRTISLTKVGVIHGLACREPLLMIIS